MPGGLCLGCKRWIHDEVNTERQILLAKLLNPPPAEVLSRIPKVPNGRCLDLGCGQGNTTRLLASVLEPAECIGFDYDHNLVQYAAGHEQNPPCVRFEQGNAMDLPYEKESFDVVFTRYLLVHMGWVAGW